MCSPDSGASEADGSEERCLHPGGRQPAVSVTRRRAVLGAAGTGIAASLAGCLDSLGPLIDDDSDGPDPRGLGDGVDCDVCGMVIDKHPGPNGQIFYEDEGPDGHSLPARFDSLKQCFFPYRLEHDEMGWTETAAYVTDYSSVDYDVSSEGGTTTISSHVEPSSFGVAQELQYVVGSDVQGAMGPDFVPFSDGDDAAAFADEYGGDVVAFDEIGEGLVGR